MPLSSRLAAKSEGAYSDDKTTVNESIMPTFLPKKVSKDKTRV